MIPKVLYLSVKLQSNALLKPRYQDFFEENPNMRI